MQLLKCCCYIQLRTGVIVIGVSYAMYHIAFGLFGIYFALSDVLPREIHKFFDKLNARMWVVGFSVFFLALSLADFSLIHAAYKENPINMEPWLVIKLLIFILTLCTAVLGTLAILRICIDLYCLLAVYSYHSQLLEEIN